MPNLLFFPLPLPSTAAEISSSLYWESARVCRVRRGQGGEGDEVGEGHGVQKPGGCEGKNLACRESGEIKEVFCEGGKRKGEAGGDRLQKVKKEGIEIGRILYEKKETKSFLGSWISKIQTDMKESKASVGIIFTTALPRDFDKELGYISKKNIFICKYDFDALRYLAYTRRQALEALYEKNQGKKESNKKSAEEFFEEPTTQNIFNLIDSKFVNHGGSLKSAKLAISKAETSYLEILKEIDELFKITEPFGLKRKK